MAVKTSTRKRVNGRKRVSKQNKLINVDRAVTTLKSTTSSTLTKFVQSYQAVAIFMFTFATLITLSIFQKGGPVGEIVYRTLEWCFGYGIYAMPVLFLYGSAILIRDKETVKSEKVLTGTFYVQIISSAAFHSLIHAEPVPISAGSELITKSGGHVSAFIVHPLTNFFGLEMTHTLLLISLVMSVLYMTDIELKDLIGGVQAVFKYIYKFIFAFFLARKEANSLQVENIFESDESPKNNKTVKNIESGNNKIKDKVENISNFTDFKQKKVVSSSKNNTKTKSSKEYKLPPVSLLKQGSSLSTSKKLLQQTAKDLTQLLNEHGVEAELTNVVPGPTVTRYEIELAPGVKVSKVTSLSHDIAYALATPDVRLLLSLIHI